MNKRIPVHSAFGAQIEELVEEIVSCADELDGGKEDARRLALDLIVVVQDQTRAGIAAQLRDFANEID